MTELYFAYGSNLHKEQMQKRCPDSRPIAMATLKGFELVFRGVADIVPKKGEFVAGALYEVSAKDKAALDRYEGYPTLYTRFTFPVKVKGLPHTHAFVYIMTGGVLRPPTVHYWNTIRQGYIDWGWPVRALAEKGTPETRTRRLA